jgi:hypothetical protein
MPAIVAVCTCTIVRCDRVDPHRASEHTPLLGLTSLLAQSLVPYTVEFDNEFEHRTPHGTSVGGQSAAGGPLDFGSQVDREGAPGEEL